MRTMSQAGSGRGRRRRLRLALSASLLAVAVTGASIGAAVPMARRARAPAPVVFVVPIDGMIDLGLSPFLARSIRDARIRARIVLPCSAICCTSSNIAAT